MHYARLSPVTCGITYGEEDGLVFILRLAEGLLSPRHPIHWIVRVLQEIRGRLPSEEVALAVPCRPPSSISSSSSSFATTVCRRSRHRHCCYCCRVSTRVPGCSIAERTCTPHNPADCWACEGLDAEQRRLSSLDHEEGCTQAQVEPGHHLPEKGAAMLVR